MAWTYTHESASNGTSSITLSEVAINDSNKDLVFDTDVAFGAYLQILSVRIEITATATGGTRTMTMEILSAGDDVLRQIILDVNTVTATNSGSWEVATGNDPSLSSTPQYVLLAENVLLHEGQKLQIKDSAAIDAAADDMVIHVHGIVHS